MKLSSIIPLRNEICLGSKDIEISSVSYDSRNIQNGGVFFALSGHTTDGRKYIPQALESGASVIVTDKEIKGINAVQIIVDDVASYMALFCAKFFNHPDRELKIIGVTGTNGKTTITYMIESILAHLGIGCAVFGTVSYRYAGKIIAAPNTTPQSLDVYKMMREAANAGVKYLAMEVSSHALSLGRVAGIDFDIAVWTNLTQDHLDFHKTMDAYFAAKASLFTGLGAGPKKNEKFAIINADDEYGVKLSKMPLKAQVKTYSAKENFNADFQAKNINIDGSGSKFDVFYGGQTGRVDIKHIGLHNVHNALAALGAVVCAGVSFEQAVSGINNSAQAPGRLERVNSKNLGFEVVVDYAHTDDALKNVLQALKALNPSRIITVFGAGGDRDRTKRPLMGKTAVEMSDFVFITSDNPRTEEPKQILLDIEVGIKRSGKNNYKVVCDRDTAIKEAVISAQSGDIVLVAGKGHENYQIVGSEKFHFNDCETAEKYINERLSLKNSKKEKGQKEFSF